MYELCKEYTDYNPDSGVGALSWSQIDTMCHKLDCPGTLAKKPDDYSEFQKMAKENTTLLLLVSSNNDTAIWKDVPGHYVNHWLYDESSDQVFLTDSKGPKRNRTYVDLQDVYNALKTSSSYQIYIIPQIIKLSKQLRSIRQIIKMCKPCKEIVCLMYAIPASAGYRFGCYAAFSI